MSLAELNSDIAAFRHYLQSERGMADNTVQAYGRDLDGFAQWAEEAELKDYLRPTIVDLSRYVSHLREQGLAPASSARLRTP